MICINICSVITVNSPIRDVAVFQKHFNICGICLRVALISKLNKKSTNLKQNNIYNIATNSSA